MLDGPELPRCLPLPGGAVDWRVLAGLSTTKCQSALCARQTLNLCHNYGVGSGFELDIEPDASPKTWNDWRCPGNYVGINCDQRPLIPSDLLLRYADQRYSLWSNSAARSSRRRLCRNGARRHRPIHNHS